MLGQEVIMNNTASLSDWPSLHYEQTYAVHVHNSHLCSNPIIDILLGLLIEKKGDMVSIVLIFCGVYCEQPFLVFSYLL